MSNQLQVSGEAKIRAIQGPVVANSGVITALDGDASEYVRGDGTLADFPTSTGGGSSVSYYLNTSVSQGTIGGVAYKQLSKVPISGAGTDVTTSANGYIASYITDANDPALLEVPAGNFNCEFYFSVNSNVHNPYVYAEVYKYDGTTFTLLGSNVSIPQYLSNGTTLSPYYFAIAVSTAVLTVTDRIAIRIYVNVDTRTVTLHTENNHLCQVVTTFSKGLISLNNLTRQNQFFATGTSGTDFNISSVTATHTFNIPDASASARGLITTGIQTIAGSKTFSSAITADSGITLKEGVIPSAVGYTGLAGDADGLVITKRVSSTAYTNLLYFNSATSNTYTFPNASGTIALTSNLSSYVPYTGATGAVNLGAFDLTVNGVNVGKGAGSGLTYNTRVGALNFMSNTTGAYNSSFGYESLNANTTGLSNTAIGFGSLSINTTGNYNTAIGSATMQLNITGSNNTAVGYGALGYNLGSNNIAVGSTALVNNTTGSNNTAIGPQAGSQITTGANNTLVGGFIGSPTISNNIILSDGAGNIRYRWDGTNNVFGNPISATSAVFSSSLVASVLQSTSGIILSTTVQVTPSSPSIAICGTPTGLEYRTSANVNSLIFQAANYTYTFPAATGTLALTSNITSAISGTTNYHAKFTGTNTIGNSLIWDNGTNVGIGNTNTSYTLDVSGTGRFTSTLLVTGAATFSSSVTMGGDLALTPTDSAISFSSGAGRFFTGGAERMRITSGGNVAIGTGLAAANSFSFYQNYSGGQLGFDFYNSSSQIVFGFNGNTQTIGLKGLSGTGSRAVLADANGTLSAPVSDISVKQNIVPIGYGLNEILKMNPIWFDFIEEYKNYGQGRQNGNIAQEIEAIIPEAVFVTELTGKMGINYDQLHAVYIKAIQELQEQINELKNK